MKTLRNYQQRSPDTFAQEFYRLLVLPDKSTEQQAEEERIDNARRHVRKFFNKIQVFYQGGIIDHDFVTNTWGPVQVEYLNEVLCPLEHAKALALSAMNAQSDKARDHALEKTRDFAEFYTTLLGSP